MEYQEKLHGPVLLEYVDKPKNEWTYRLTQYGCVFRKKDGEDVWVKFYDVMLHAVPAHVALVRKAPFQKITMDNYDGPLPEQPKITAEPVRAVKKRKVKPIVTETVVVDELPPLPETQSEGRKRVAETKEKPKKEPAAKKEPAVDKPQRLGARAKKLLEMDLGLTTKEKEEVRAKADAISRARVLQSGRRDGLTRVWDIYEAAGKEMPASLVAEKEDFMKTGVLKRSKSNGGNGGGAAKAERGGKNAASTAPNSGTSKQQQSAPEPKPAHDGPQQEAEDAQPKAEPPTSDSSTDETETL